MKKPPQEFCHPEECEALRGTLRRAEAINAVEKPANAEAARTISSTAPILSAVVRSFTSAPPRFRMTSREKHGKAREPRQRWCIENDADRPNPRRLKRLARALPVEKISSKLLIIIDLIIAVKSIELALRRARNPGRASVRSWLTATIRQSANVRNRHSAI